MLLGWLELIQPSACQKNDVESFKRLLIKAKAIAYDAFYTVTLNRQTDVFFSPQLDLNALLLSHWVELT
jgi:hypothetical protein